jgi:hypothetical protein
MQPLTPDDLLPLDEYARRRAEFFAAHQRYLDRYRRVRIGPCVTLVFENRQTLWFRVQEILRVARLSEPDRVQQELDWYNALLPRRGRLQAALVLSGTDGSDPDPWRDFSGEHLRLRVGGDAWPAVLVTCRPEDRSIGLAHWVELPCDADARRALGDPRRPARFELEYPAYPHSSPLLSEECRQSLLDDLALADRGR